eukprot:CCRYP_003038-RA/>CCRYP_003038-RA protein AED:0.01 eAED:0.01 QI:113/1/1/1/1/1/2/70/1134
MASHRQYQQINTPHKKVLSAQDGQLGSISGDDAPHRRHRSRERMAKQSSGSRRTRAVSLDKYSLAEEGRVKKLEEEVMLLKPPSQKGRVRKLDQEVLLFKPPSRNVFSYLRRMSPSKSGELKNGFMLPHGKRLSPRSDAWLVLSISSACTFGSLLISTVPTMRTAFEATAVLSSSIVVAISTFVAFGFRYDRIRNVITHAITFPSRWSNPLSKVFSIEWSRETMLSISSLLLTVVTTSIVMTSTMFLATSEYEVWNANLFCSCWIGLYACLYLAGDLLTTSDPRGIIDRPSESISIDSSFHHVTAKLWFMSMGSSIFVLGSLLDLYSSTVCASSLQGTSLCTRALAAVLIALASLLCSVIAQEIHRVSFSEGAPRITLNCFRGDHCAYKSYRCIGFILSLLVFTLNSVNVGMVCSPSGPGFEMGSIFITTWISFAYSFVTVKRYLEMFCTPLSSPREHIFSRFDSSFISECSTAADSYWRSDDDDDDDSTREKKSKKKRRSSRESKRKVSPALLESPEMEVIVRVPSDRSRKSQKRSNSAPRNLESRRSSSKNRSQSNSDVEMTASSSSKPRRHIDKASSSTKTGSTTYDTEMTSFSSKPEPAVYATLSNRSVVSSLGVPGVPQEPTGTKVGVLYCGKQTSPKQTPAPAQTRRPEETSSRKIPKVPSQRHVADEPSNESGHQSDPPPVLASTSKKSKHPPGHPSALGTEFKYPDNFSPYYLPKRNHHNAPEVELPSKKHHHEEPEVELPLKNGSQPNEQSQQTGSLPTLQGRSSSNSPLHQSPDEGNNFRRSVTRDVSQKGDNFMRRSSSSRKTSREQRHDVDHTKKRSSSPKRDIKHTKSSNDSALNLSSALRNNNISSASPAFDISVMSETSSVTNPVMEGFGYSDKWTAQSNTVSRATEPESESSSKRLLSDIDESFNVLFNESSQSDLTKDASDFHVKPPSKPDHTPRGIRLEDDTQSFLNSADSSEFTSSSRVASVNEVVDLALAYARSTIRNLQSAASINLSPADSMQSMFSDTSDITKKSQNRTAINQESTKVLDNPSLPKRPFAHRRSSLGSEANPAPTRFSRTTVPSAKSKSFFIPGKESSVESIDSEATSDEPQLAGILRKMTPSFHARQKTVSFHDKNTIFAA